MRARNREINIFNMSLLDILCGALGAFCFMMLVLLPYYKPGTGADAQKQVELDETLKDIDKLKEKLKDAELAKELAELIEKLKTQIKELEGRVNNLVAQNTQLQGQVDDLNSRNKQLQSEKDEMQKKVNNLERREPFSVFITLGNPLEPGQRGLVHLYLWQNNRTVKNEFQKPFDPRKESYDVFWIGEQSYGVTGRNPYSSWMVMNADAGTTWKIYAKLEMWTPDPADAKKKTPLPISGTMNMIGSVSSSAGIQSLPEITVSAEHPWVLAGFITTDKNDNTKVTVRGATDAERAAEWKALDRK